MSSEECEDNVMVKGGKGDYILIKAAKDSDEDDEKQEHILLRAGSEGEEEILIEINENVVESVQLEGENGSTAEESEDSEYVETEVALDDEHNRSIDEWCIDEEDPCQPEDLSLKRKNTEEESSETTSNKRVCVEAKDSNVDTKEAIVEKEAAPESRSLLKPRAVSITPVNYEVRRGRPPNCPANPMPTLMDPGPYTTHPLPGKDPMPVAPVSSSTTSYSSSCNSNNSRPNGEKIKRPMNAFMVWAKEYRTFLSKQLPASTNSNISCMLGEIWNKMKESEKDPYYREAHRLKMEHRQKYPDWTYKPSKRNASSKRAESTSPSTHRDGQFTTLSLNNNQPRSPAPATNTVHSMGCNRSGCSSARSSSCCSITPPPPPPRHPYRPIQPRAPGMPPIQYMLMPSSTSPSPIGTPTGRPPTMSIRRNVSESQCQTLSQTDQPSQPTGLIANQAKFNALKQQQKCVDSKKGKTTDDKTKHNCSKNAASAENTSSTDTSLRNEPDHNVTTQRNGAPPPDGQHAGGSRPSTPWAVPPPASWRLVHHGRNTPTTRYTPTGHYINPAGGPADWPLPFGPYPAAPQYHPDGGSSWQPHQYYPHHYYDDMALYGHAMYRDPSLADDYADPHYLQYHSSYRPQWAASPPPLNVPHLNMDSWSNYMSDPACVSPPSNQPLSQQHSAFRAFHSHHQVSPPNIPPHLLYRSPAPDGFQQYHQPTQFDGVIAPNQADNQPHNQSTDQTTQETQESETAASQQSTNPSTTSSAVQNQPQEPTKEVQCTESAACTEKTSPSDKSHHTMATQTMEEVDIQSETSSQNSELTVT